MGSLFYQFKSAIDGNFVPGLDKHSYKRNKNKKKLLIVSYEYRRSLIKFSHTLCDYLKNQYDDVKNIKDITSDHMQSFFDYKSSYCSAYTIRQYCSYTRTLDKLIKQHFHFNSYLSKGYIISKVPKNYNQVKIRNISMKPIHYNAVIKVLENSNSAALSGIKLAEAFGLRVSEICKLKGKDINLDDGFIHIHDSKGKRSRNLPIDTLFKIELCRNIKNNIDDNDRVCPIRENSVNAALRRALLKNNITVYSQSKTGIHSIRKMVSKEVLNSFKTSGMTNQESIDFTSNFLGHNKNRNYVINSYIKSQ